MTKKSPRRVGPSALRKFRDRQQRPQLPRLSHLPTKAGSPLFSSPLWHCSKAIGELSLIVIARLVFWLLASVFCLALLYSLDK